MTQIVTFNLQARDRAEIGSVSDLVIASRHGSATHELWCEAPQEVEAVIMAKYRSSDRAHITPTKWTKAERAEWVAQSREDAQRAVQNIEAGNCRNALAVLFQNERLEAHGITTGAHIDARRMFFDRCLATRSLSGAKKRRK